MSTRSARRMGIRDLARATRVAPQSPTTHDSRHEKAARLGWPRGSLFFACARVARFEL